LGVDQPKGYLITGSAPKPVHSVRIVLSDGSSRVIPTFNAGKGWSVRFFGTALPGQNSYVKEIEGLNASGHVVDTAMGVLLLHGDTSSMIESSNPGT
jgi:hypothetical protein